MKAIILSLFLSLPTGEYSTEKSYQVATCKGRIEYKLDDSTRVDCLTAKNAIEYDFAQKWHEALGQSLHYARMTERKAGIVLIFKKETDLKYYHRLMQTIAENCLKIDVWIIKED